MGHQMTLTQYESHHPLRFYGYCEKIL